eukprot:gene23939-9506_t
MLQALPLLNVPSRGLEQVEQKAKGAPSEREMSCSKSLTVLLVDSKFASRRHLAQLLQDCGYKATPYNARFARLSLRVSPPSKATAPATYPVDVTDFSFCVRAFLLFVPILREFRPKPLVVVAQLLQRTFS